MPIEQLFERPFLTPSFPLENPTMISTATASTTAFRALRRAFLAACVLVPLAHAPAAFAQPVPLKVEAAWIRASVPGQSGTGGFMRLTAAEPLTLVGVQTPVAGVAELHEMKMEGDVMRMRAVPAIPLAAGKPFDLRPGGHHLMLMNLKAPLKDGSQVPVTLLLRDAKGAERRVPVQVPVALRAPGAAAAPSTAPAGGMHDHGHKH